MVVVASGDDSDDEDADDDNALGSLVVVVVPLVLELLFDSDELLTSELSDGRRLIVFLLRFVVFLETMLD